MKFELDASVKILPMPHNTLTDYQADLMSSFDERDISGAVYDRIWKALEMVQEGKSPIFTICEIGDDDYGLKLGKTALPFMFDEAGLEAI
jgi:hypothetical protein